MAGFLSDSGQLQPAIEQIFLRIKPGPGQDLRLRNWCDSSTCGCGIFCIGWSSHFPCVSIVIFQILCIQYTAAFYAAHMGTFRWFQFPGLGHGGCLICISIALCRMHMNAPIFPVSCSTSPHAVFPKTVDTASDIVIHAAAALRVFFIRPSPFSALYSEKPFSANLLLLLSKNQTDMSSKCTQDVIFLHKMSKIGRLA